MRKWFVFGLVMASLFTGCKKEQLDDCFRRTGEDVTVERPLSAFNQLVVGDKFKIILTQDTSQSEKAIITAGEHIIEGLTTEIKDSVLTIENCNKCNFVRSYKREVQIELVLHNLKDIEVFGATSITTSDTLELENLNIFHSALEDIDLQLNLSGELSIESINSGGTKLHGKANKLSGSIEEITDMDARNFVCKEVIFDTHTPLDCYINATKLIYVGIYNKGNIYYVHEPSDYASVHETIGEGKLLKLGN